MILIWPSNDDKYPSFTRTINAALRIDLSIERESRKKNNRLEDRYLRCVFPANYELL